MKKSTKPGWPYFGSTEFVRVVSSQTAQLEQSVRFHFDGLAQNMRIQEAEQALNTCDGLSSTNCGWADFEAAKHLREAIYRAWPHLKEMPHPRSRP